MIRSTTAAIAPALFNGNKTAFQFHPQEKSSNYFPLNTVAYFATAPFWFNFSGTIATNKLSGELWLLPNIKISAKMLDNKINDLANREKLFRKWEKRDNNKKERC